jgi:hypothetical protein
MYIAPDTRATTPQRLSAGNIPATLPEALRFTVQPFERPIET